MAICSSVPDGEPGIECCPASLSQASLYWTVEPAARWGSGSAYRCPPIAFQLWSASVLLLLSHSRRLLVDFY
ncbi:hypothetical protein N7510_003026 [Penicillium lagena]|uniref:uncharacterized protein n=1 Tax=Penicillium lagena TaxID=94218 RepID=UPI002540D205|nr:uncharacterized protein N7510_003026 [Penicillium lagena]KAJ5619042.1 hypothetical protein N7510_003026 [Penicillium lagena]